LLKPTGICILGIDGAISRSIDILQVLDKTIYDNKRLAQEIFNMGYFIKDKEWTSLNEALHSDRTYTFLTNDRVLLNKFGSYMLFQSGNLSVYVQCINAYRDYSTKMIEFLKKEYRLKKTD
jgi:hypothetical protein